LPDRGALPTYLVGVMHSNISFENPLRSTTQIVLPREQFRLEEINMPEELACALAGQAVAVEVLPEEPPLARRFDLDDPPVGLPMLIDQESVLWNDHWPMRVVYEHPCGRVWSLPRHWLSVGVSPVIEVSRYEVTHESSWVESWCPPTWWDLWDVNIQEVPEPKGMRGPGDIEVNVAPGEVPRVFWKGSSGKLWRIPHDWRRRRIRLPDCDGLLRNSLPQDIAEQFGNRIVAVNYHPGSLCCMSDGYRVRDGRGGKWPVRAADCVVVGFGDETERFA
jgi:hypothetical protein